MRVLIGLLLTGLLVTGCGDERPVATLPTPNPTPTVTPTSEPTPASALHRRAARLLAKVGVTDIAERGPLGGGAGESLTGTWQGHQVVVDVIATDEASFAEPAVRSYRVRDRAARVVEVPPYVMHRVNLGPLLWDVAVPDDEDATEALVKALVDSQLPPEETPAELVAVAANLYGARVQRTGDRFDVTSLWGVYCEHGGGCDPAVLVRQVGADRTYEVGTWDDLQSALWTGEDRPDNPFGAAFLAQRVPSLAPGVEALVGGGDGATLLPFQLVSRNGGPPQQVSHPQRTQTAGAVMLSDGRLLVLLTPALGEYGLWVSDGDDWTTYTPVPLPAGLRGLPTSLDASLDPDPVLWLETDAGQVLVSTDDGASFRELDLR